MTSENVNGSTEDGKTNGEGIAGTKEEQISNEEVQDDDDLGSESIDENIIKTENFKEETTILVSKDELINPEEVLDTDEFKEPVSLDTNVIEIVSSQEEEITEQQEKIPEVRKEVPVPIEKKELPSLPGKPQ